MISRRNIRVKVMQTLYTVSTLEIEAQAEEPIKILQKAFRPDPAVIHLYYLLSNRGITLLRNRRPTSSLQTFAKRRRSTCKYKDRRQ